MNTPTKFFRAKEIAQLLSIGRSTWWLWVKTGKVPKGFKLSPRVTVWKAEDIETFVSKKTGMEVLNG